MINGRPLIGVRGKTEGRNCKVMVSMEPCNGKLVGHKAQGGRDIHVMYDGNKTCLGIKLGL